MEEALALRKSGESGLRTNLRPQQVCACGTLKKDKSHNGMVLNIGHDAVIVFLCTGYLNRYSLPTLPHCFHPN